MPERAVWLQPRIGGYSRIDDEHRLVYLVTETEIIILAARYQY